MGCFSGCLMSSAGIQKLFWGFYSAFECSFDEFVGKKMISPSYSSTILGPPLNKIFKEQLLFLSLILSNSLKLQLWNFLLACTTMQSRTCLYISYFLQRVGHDWATDLIWSDSLHRAHNVSENWPKNGLSTDYQTQNTYFFQWLSTNNISQPFCKDTFIRQSHHFGRHDKTCLKCGKKHSWSYFSRKLLSSCVGIAINSDRLISRALHISIHE